MKVLGLVFVLLFSPLLVFSQGKTPEQTESVTLPNTPDSWIINIHQRGGILGVHKLLVTINSEGNYACSESGKVKSVSQTDADFLELAKIIHPISDDLFFQKINEDLASCNDCLYSTLSLRRQHETTTDGEFITASYPKNSNPTPKEIAQKVWKVVKCN